MKNPNILLIYADQMRFDATSFAGNEVVRTPNYDAMAAAGAYFEHAYTSFPLCCPFRASLMTGLYAHSNGMCTNHYPIDLDCVPAFLPELAAAQGYRTGWIGKWHLNGGNKFDFVPRTYQLGFDTFIGYSRGHHYINGIFYRNEDPTPRTSPRYEPEYQTSHAIEFMSSALAENKPFLAMICYGLPHSPVDMAPDHYKQMYAPEQIRLPVTVPHRKAEHSKAYRANYYGLVTCVDDQLARLDHWLKEQSIYDNTVVIFVSDHGDLCGEHGLEYKSSFYEGAAHVPLVIRWPEKIPAGVRVGQIVDPSVDLFPTILQLCGAQAPDYAAGHSLFPAAYQGNDPVREDMGYYELLKVSDAACAVLDVQEHKRYPERGLRTREWLYVEKCGVPYALFHLTEDPLEQFNLVSAPECQDTVRHFRAMLARKMEEYGDRWDIQAGAPPPDYQTHEAGKKFYSEVLARAVTEA